MVKTVVNRIDSRTSLFEGSFKFLVELRKQAGIEVFLCNSRLIGYNDDGHPNVVQLPNGPRNMGEDIELRKRERGVYDPRVLMID